jgi:hypothetical protein
MNKEAIQQAESFKPCGACGMEKHCTSQKKCALLLKEELSRTHSAAGAEWMQAQGCAPRWVKASESPKKSGMYICHIRIKEDGQTFLPVAYSNFDADKGEWTDPTVYYAKGEVVNWLDESGCAPVGEAPQKQQLIEFMTFLRDEIRMPILYSNMDTYAQEYLEKQWGNYGTEASNTDEAPVASHSVYDNKAIEQWKAKAEKWDALAARIEKYYVNENGEEAEEGGDLCDIGEVAAHAFGWL